MKIYSDILILGAGMSGLVLNHTIKKVSDACKNPILLEKGYPGIESNNTYVTFLKHKTSYSCRPFKAQVQMINPGWGDVDKLYSFKLYNKLFDLNFFQNINKSEIKTYYNIDVPKLLKNANIYGNVEVTEIDLFSKTVHGKVLHLNEEVTANYDILVNTLPIHKFAKMSGIDLYKQFKAFIQYYPIGIKHYQSAEYREKMEILYWPDPNVPFYRTHFYGNDIWYEYCLSKSNLGKIKFDHISIPGKFIRLNTEIYELINRYLEALNVYLVGRYALWNPDFLIDDIDFILTGKEAQIKHDSLISLYSKLDMLNNKEF